MGFNSAFKGLNVYKMNWLHTEETVVGSEARRPYYGGSRFFWNFSFYLSDYTASCPRIRQYQGLFFAWDAFSCSYYDRRFIGWFFFFFRWRYSPLWALVCRKISLYCSLYITSSLHLLTLRTWKSLSTSSLHPFLGLPLRLVPSSSWVKIFLGILSSCILSRWPRQLILRLVAITNEMQLSKGIYYSTVH